MKTLWNVFSIVLLINVLVLIGVATKLYTDGHISRARIERTVAIYTPTLEQEKKDLKKQVKLEAAALLEEKNQQWRKKVEEGPVSVEDKINADIQQREQMDQIVSRLRRDRQALLDAMENYKNRIEQLQLQLSRQREQFEKRVEQTVRQAKSAGFKQAVAMYEQTKPRQAKQMFTKLINANASGRSQVIQYLAAMQPRNAAAVLKQFKTDQEITEAAGLIEGLRKRGMDLLDEDLPNPEPTP